MQIYYGSTKADSEVPIGNSDLTYKENLLLRKLNTLSLLLIGITVIQYFVKPHTN